MSVMEPQLISNYLPIPQWLNQNFLEKSIRKHSKKDSVYLQNFTIVPATAKGENFASIMFRVKVNYHFGDEVILNGTFYLFPLTQTPKLRCVIYSYKRFIELISRSKGKKLS